MIRTDYQENLSQYASNIHEGALQKIIKYCGIALKGQDSQYVSMSDDAEIVRVVKGFAAKKLGLDEEATREGLKKVHQVMKAEKFKMRTTVYYLLAEQTGMLSKLA
jgi:hypothetical protein